MIDTARRFQLGLLIPTPKLRGTLSGAPHHRLASMHLSSHLTCNRIVSVSLLPMSQIAERRGPQGLIALNQLARGIPCLRALAAAIAVRANQSTYSIKSELLLPVLSYEMMRKVIIVKRLGIKQACDILYRQRDSDKTLSNRTQSNNARQQCDSAHDNLGCGQRTCQDCMLCNSATWCDTPVCNHHFISIPTSHTAQHRRHDLSAFF